MCGVINGPAQYGQLHWTLLDTIVRHTTQVPNKIDVCVLGNNC